MLKRNHFYTALLATSAVFVSSAAIAQQTTAGQATVEISNAFVLAQTTPVNFGTLRIFNDTVSGGDTTTVTIPGNANPMTVVAGTPAESSGTIITAGEPGEFAITEAAPFTPLTITFPTGVTLANGTAPPSTPSFAVTFADATTFVLAANGSTSVYDATNLVTDGAGAVSFRLGGVLVTDATATTSYADGEYSGAFNMVVAY